MAMTCLCKDHDGIERLTEYLGGACTAERRAELELHAQECVECRGLLRAWNALDEYAAPEVSPDFDAKLYARIGQEKLGWWSGQRTWWQKTLWPSGPLAWWKPAIPVAACAALLIALLTRVPTSTPVDGSKQAKAEPVNIEQVEQALEDMDLLAPAEL
jgi:hypothetical protein